MSHSPPVSPSGPSSSSPTTPTGPASRPARARLAALLRQTLRLSVLDGRVFVGTFVGTDRALNVLLASAQEYRPRVQARAEAQSSPSGPQFESAAGGEAGVDTATAQRRWGRTKVLGAEGRFVGQVMIPWRLVVSAEAEGRDVDDTGAPGGAMDDADGMYM